RERRDDREADGVAETMKLRLARRPSPRPSPKGEGGVAAITAILIVAVAASAATVMLSQQAAMIDQVALVASRAQADQYAQAGVDWARGILVQDLGGGAVDSLDEAWAK